MNQMFGSLASCIADLTQGFLFMSFSLFYPHISFAPSSQLMQFSLGYFFRFISLGVLGIFSINEKRIFTLLLFLMILSTFGMTVLPDTASSFYVLNMLRAVQSACFYTEPTVSAKFAGDNYTKESWWGLFVSQISSASVVNYSVKGCIYASAVFWFIGSMERKISSWRMVFFAGAILGCFAFLLAFSRRRHSPAFERYVLLAENVIFLGVVTCAILSSFFVFLPSTGFKICEDAIRFGFSLSMNKLFFLMPFLLGLFDRRLMKILLASGLIVIGSSLLVTQIFMISIRPEMAPLSIISLFTSAFLLRVTSPESNTPLFMSLFKSVAYGILAPLIGANILAYVLGSSFYFFFSVNQVVSAVCIINGLIFLKRTLRELELPHKQLLPFIANFCLFIGSLWNCNFTYKIGSLSMTQAQFFASDKLYSPTGLFMFVCQICICAVIASINIAILRSTCPKVSI